MKQTLDAKRLTALIGARRFHALRDELAGKNEVDIAQFLGGLAPEQAVLAFRTLPKDDASDVFSELDSEMQQAIIASVTDAELADIVEDLAMDDAGTLYAGERNTEGATEHGKPDILIYGRPHHGGQRRKAQRGHEEKRGLRARSGDSLRNAQENFKSHARRAAGRNRGGAR